MATAQSVTGLLTPDTPFSQLAFEDRKHEARAILVRMFMVGLHPDDDPDSLWNRLCEIGGLEQACLLAGGSQWHMTEKFGVIHGQHLDAAAKGSILAEFQLGQYFATRDPATDIPRDEHSARAWLNRALANTSAEDDTIFGTVHYKRLAQDELAKLDAAPVVAMPLVETTPVQEPFASESIAAIAQPAISEVHGQMKSDQMSLADAGTARAKRISEKFLLTWIVVGILIAILGYLSSRYVACMPNALLAPEARAANPLCPSSIPVFIRLSAVIASFGTYALAAIAAALLLYQGGRHNLRSDPQGSALFVKLAGLTLTLCSLPVAYICLKFVRNLVLGWLLP